MELPENGEAGEFALAEPLEKSSTLPDPRLNPLMNPTLGRNLGRWAQVYFTSPPEKRESAVVELLRELEGDAPPEPSVDPAKAARPTPSQSAAADRVSIAHPPATNQNSGQSPAVPPIETKSGEPAPAVVPEPEMIALPPVTSGEPLQEQMACPSCQGKNPASQAYCGICGAALRPASGRTNEASPTAAPPAYAGRELQWLRERVPENWSEEEHASGHPWRYVVATLVIVFGMLAYIEWGPRNTAVTSATPIAKAPASVIPPSAETRVPVNAPPASTAPAAIKEEKQKAEETKPAASAERGAKEPTTSVGGEQEFVEARRILAIPGQSGDTSEAAKLLWKAVGKQNPSATLMLADLYLRGEGVPRNCEQARLLLLAAARKGSTDAAGKLQQVESSGCP